MANSITAGEIREQSSQVVSAMYQQGVPQCGTLLELVADIGLVVSEDNLQPHKKMVNAGELVRLNVERHGVIRVGTAQELATLRRMFAIMGVYPVSYYDLSQTGVPVHSTAFRPTDDVSLTHNPFRVFTLLLRLELIENEILRQKAVETLRQRDIFTPRCRQLLEKYEQQDGFNETQAQELMQEVLETFRWHQSTAVDEETYRTLYNKHRLIADVVCFPGCHINHLTLHMPDIDRVQSMIPECGIEPKVLTEGPPCRKVSILLRRTSFKALEEMVSFAEWEQGTYAVCFGETEQRGVTLAPEGRQLYDDLPRSVGAGQGNLTHQVRLQETFRTFPGSELLMRQQGLGWSRYRLMPPSEAHRQAIHPGDDPQPLIERGWAVAQPITHGDSLLISVMGIFQLNLGNKTQACNHDDTSRETFEWALGGPILDEF